MIDTLIFLLALSPLIVTTVWYIIELHEINLHKQEMEQLWDLYAEESTLPGNEELYPDGPITNGDKKLLEMMHRHHDNL